MLERSRGRWRFLLVQADSPSRRAPPELLGTGLLARSEFEVGAGLSWVELVCAHRMAAAGNLSVHWAERRIDARQASSRVVTIKSIHS